MPEITTDIDILEKLISIKDQRILDIGSGDGSLVRHLTGKGAMASGLECGDAQLEKARAYTRVGEEAYVEGVGQNLPFDNDSFEVVIFFNSLHHIAVNEMSNALDEAGRVGVKGGKIYVAEPIAAGSGFEFSAPVDDETAVRAMAHKCVQNAISNSLTQICEVFYDTVYHYQKFEDFKEEMIRIDPSREIAFKTMEPELRTAFDRFGIVDEIGVRFDQPMRVNLLEIR